MVFLLERDVVVEILFCRLPAPELWTDRNRPEAVRRSRFRAPRRARSACAARAATQHLHIVGDDLGGKPVIPCLSCHFRVRNLPSTNT